MVPFAIILIAQILLFAILSSILEMSDMYAGIIEKKEGEEILGDNVFNEIMVIIGGPKAEIRSGDQLRWALFMIYAILMNVVNMKLLISMIGETFAKYQVSRVHLGYNMKVNYLLEYSALLNKIRNLVNSIWYRNKRVESSWFFHWFVYKDSYEQNNN